jgi:hypothetical protein
MNGNDFLFATQGLSISLPLYRPSGHLIIHGCRLLPTPARGG